MLSRMTKFHHILDYEFIVLDIHLQLVVIHNVLSFIIVSIYFFIILFFIIYISI